MQKAIEIAIENGWNPKPNYFWLEGVYNWGVRFGGDDGDREDFRNETILLDPDFWQALVKGVSKDNYYNYEIRPADSNFYEQGHWNEWQYQWCSFTSHLANGGDINEFFEELCKEK